jgi:uncharacterized protein YqjF (DUF2071 family)
MGHSLRAESMDRLIPSRRPEGPPAGSQKWRNLLFVHWRVPVRTLRALVPEPLAIDTFEGHAYVGLVPFEMHDLRPSRFLPPIPTAARFDETNVRTYVHLGGRDPGVWFFSLDASSALAVMGARALFHLPYWHARIRTRREGRNVLYRCDRHWAGGTPAALALDYEVGEEPSAAVEGTLEHFLVERYILYAVTPSQALLRAQVHHSPYPVRRARIVGMRESLVAAAGIERSDEPASVVCSEGVDVEIFPLRRATLRP